MSNDTAMSIAGCGKCICRTCLYWQSGRCPYGSCYDDKRAKDNPYDKAHPDEPPRTAWSDWKTDQAFWCRGGVCYQAFECDRYVEYTGCTVKDCLDAVVGIYQDGYISCTLVDSFGCEECYKRFEEKIKKEESGVSEELQEVVDKKSLWMGYEISSNEQVKNIIRNNINHMCDNWISTGFALKQARDKEFYKEDGYSCIQDYAFGEFGIKKQRVSRLIKIIETLSVNGNSPVLEDKWKSFSIAKLEEIIYLDEEQQEQVVIGSTVAEIREIKNPEKVSTSKQEPKPSGNCLHRPEYPCTLPEASKLAQGDGVDCNAKCCWGCSKHGNCGYECNSSAQRPVEVKQEPHDERWFVKQYFDRYQEDLVKLMSMCRVSKSRSDTAKEFQEYRSPYGAYGTGCSEWSFDFHNFDGGMDFQIGKEKMHLKYGRLVEEALKLYNPFDKEYNEPKQDKQPETVNDEASSVIETGDIVNEKSENVIAGRECANCNYDDMNPDRYREDHPEVTEFPCNSCDDKLNHWMPKVHITVKLEEDSRIHRPDLRGLMQDPYCRVCGAELEYKHDCKCGNKIDWSGLEDIFKFEEEQLKLKPEQEKVETIEADIVQTVPAKEYDFDKVSMYDLTDIKLSIIDHQHDLASYKDCELDAPIVKREKMEMDALQCLEESLYMHDMPDPDSKPEPVQPELPILKNNDQRKEWAENYKAWGEWYYDEHIDCHYYKYDFHNGDKLIIEEYQGMKRYWNKNEEYDQVNYHLCLKQKTDQWIETPHEQRYEHSTTSMTEIVDYLKDFQKKGA